MKQTPLTPIHIDLGAKMAEFAGYNMPISYVSIIDEHKAVREKVGLFDVSHMGEFIVKGKEALQLVQSITSNDAAVLEIGDAQYSCLPNETGGIVDDLLVYRLDEDKCSEGEQAFMLVVNASNEEKDFEWIKAHNQFDTRLINISNDTSLLALQGPLSHKTLAKLTDVAIEAIPYYSFLKGTVAGIDNVLISATGYTGSGGYELYVENKDAVVIWNALMEAGKEYGIQPCGLGARDTLRLEKGYALYGNDIDDTTSPIEAGLSWITKLNKEASFPSKDLFIEQKRNGVSRKLVGLTMTERRVPRHGYEVFDASGSEQIGIITSGTQSPNLDHPIAMAYIQTAFAKTGNRVMISFGKKLLEATIVKLPFLS